MKFLLYLTIILTLGLSGCAGLDFKDPYGEGPSVKERARRDMRMYSPLHHRAVLDGHGKWVDEGGTVVFKWIKKQTPVKDSLEK